MIPLILRGMDEDFRVRGNMVGVWSDYTGNPYVGASGLELVWAVIKQIGWHLTPQFLLVSGDANLRHSTQAFGMISWVEGAAVAVGLLMLKHRAFRKSVSNPEWGGVRLATLGILTGNLPAALTWESVPHALRALTAWPFWCLLGALVISKMTGPKTQKDAPSRWVWLPIGASVLFAGFYLHDYFYEYPSRSEVWFRTEDHAITRALNQMQAGAKCAELQPIIR
jgi:hypothetical protein